ncbi:MAG: amine oxidase [Sediminibacterium sp.]|nr:amine oxidase [Sediminibacterium sp.]
MSDQEKRSVIIIGAGAAGLMAANELAGAYHVTILEALDHVGGRIQTLYDQKTGCFIEAGAEFIHGKLPLTLSVATQSGATIQEVKGDMYQVSDCNWKKLDEIIEGWDELLFKMGSLPDDMTLDAFLEMYFPGPGYEALRHHTRAYAAGFDLADPVRASVRSLYQEWSKEFDKQYRIKEGYEFIIQYLKRQCIKKGCRILTGKRVKQIDWQKEEVTVYTSENEKFFSEKIIITLPTGILQTPVSYASINITPLLDNYDHAWQQIGYGSVLKVVLIFEKAFWKEQHDKIGFVFSDEAIPTWWTQLPFEAPVLTGWLGGPSAVQWDEMSDERIIELAIGSLSKIFRMNFEEIISLLSQHYIFRWHSSKTAGGAYSYETPLSEQAKQLLVTPVENTLYFAGEALYTGPYAGTVEAALSSAMEVVKKIVGTG